MSLLNLIDTRRIKCTIIAIIITILSTTILLLFPSDQLLSEPWFHKAEQTLILRKGYESDGEAKSEAEMDNVIEYHSVQYLPQLKNPCFLDEYDGKITDKEFYTSHPLVTLIEQKYAKKYIYKLHRGKVETKNKDGDVVTSRLRCLPYYYVLGVAKSGSTDLYKRMKCHQDISVSVRKESAWLSSHRFGNYSLSNYIDFFDIAATEIAQKYRKNARDGLKNQKVSTIVGDHSTNTLTSRRAYKPGGTVNGLHLPNSTAKLIKALTPNASFIIVMRDPIERAYSHYKMHYAVSPQHFDQGVRVAINWFNDCIAKYGYSDLCLYTKGPPTPKDSEYGYNGKGAVIHGLYDVYIQDWLKVFPREQFLFIKAEEYYSDTYEYVTKYVFPFLGLKRVDWLNLGTIRCMTKKAPAHVTSRMIRTGERDINVKYNESMLPETRQLLKDFYTPHNKELAKLLQDNKWNWW